MRKGKKTHNVMLSIEWGESSGDLISHISHSNILQSSSWKSLKMKIKNEENRWRDIESNNEMEWVFTSIILSASIFLRGSMRTTGELSLRIRWHLQLFIVILLISYLHSTQISIVFSEEFSGNESIEFSCLLSPIIDRLRELRMPCETNTLILNGRNQIL